MLMGIELVLCGGQFCGVSVVSCFYCFMSCCLMGCCCLVGWYWYLIVYVEVVGSWFVGSCILIFE